MKKSVLCALFAATFVSVLFLTGCNGGKEPDTGGMPKEAKGQMVNDNTKKK